MVWLTCCLLPLTGIAQYSVVDSTECPSTCACWDTNSNPSQYSVRTKSSHTIEQKSTEMIFLLIEIIGLPIVVFESRLKSLLKQLHGGHNVPYH
jgi:hypothetical protein